MEILKEILKEIREDVPVREVRRGIHWTAVVSRQCGLASTIAGTGCSHGINSGMEGSFTDMSAVELGRLSLSEDPSYAVLGLAAVNSLIRVDNESYSGIDGLNIVKEMSKGKNISVIGHFPYLESLAQEAQNLWVIEKQPQPGDHTEDQGKDLIPQSDIVVITSTTLINKTLPGILKLCRKESVKMLLGPSTPLSPVLFEYGIDILSGSIVTEKDVVLRSVGEGCSFMQLKKNGGIRFASLVRDYNDILRRMKR